MITLSFLFKLILTVLLVGGLKKLFTHFIRPYFILKKLEKKPGAICFYRPIFGIMPDLRKNQVKYGDAHYATKKLVRENPDVKFVAFPLNDFICYDLYDPSLIKEFVEQMTRTTIKDMRIISSRSELERNSLLFSEGEKWKRQKKVISKVFHFEYMNSYIPTMNHLAKEWIKENCKVSPATTPIQQSIRSYPGAMIWRIFFDEENLLTSPEAQRIVNMLAQHNVDSVTLEYDPLIRLFGPRFFKLGLRAFDRNFLNRYNQLNEFYREKVNYFKEKVKNNPNKGAETDRPRTLLELLLEDGMKVNSDEKMTDFELMSQFEAFFSSATETISIVMVMVFYMLATHSDIQRRLRDEIREYIGNIEVVEYEHIKKMPYLNAFVKEVLRMYGPAALSLPRQVIKEVNLEGLKIPKGESISVHMFGACYNPKYYEKPEEFNPDRWLEKKDPGVSNAFTFLPFLIGVRSCIGEIMSYNQIKVMVCHLLRKFEIDIKRPYELRMGFAKFYETIDPMYPIYKPL